MRISRPPAAALSSMETVVDELELLLEGFPVLVLFWAALVMVPVYEPDAFDAEAVKSELLVSAAEDAEAVLLAWVLAERERERERLAGIL